MWYDLPPSEYAKGLRFRADRNDESATRKEAEGKPWSTADASHFRRQARRLRAMATLCDRSNSASAGDVDFRRLSDPTLPRDDEDTVVSDIETLA